MNEEPKIESLEQAYSLYFDRVVAYVYKLCKNSNIALDCAQEAFRILSKRDVSKVKHVLSWLFLCSKHRYLKYKKKNDRYTFIEDYLNFENELRTEESPQTFLTDKESFDIKLKMISSLLKKLSENQRKAIKLRYYKNLSYEQIAKKMNTNVNNVGFSICTGIKNLKKHFFKIKSNQEALAN